MRQNIKSPHYLSEAVRVEPSTGRIFWIERPREHFSSDWSWMNFNKRRSGKETFLSLDGRGYLIGRISGRLYKAHLIVWALAYGEWPVGQIDHINRMKTDNRLVNLRDVSQLENCRNRGLYKNNKTGFTGVNRYGSGRWRATIKSDGKTVCLGIHDSIDAAVSARKAAETRLGYSETHGVDL